MSISRQIGWSNESNLLYQILKQLTRLTSVMFSLKPKYKVFTALVTQSGVSDLQTLYIGISYGNTLTVGVSYTITNNDTTDFTNVGAPNNNIGTSFIATGKEPNNQNNNDQTYLSYNNGAPIVTVLENTIGNVWFNYIGNGFYSLNSNNLFLINKTFINNTSLVLNPVFNRMIKDDGTGFDLQTGYFFQQFSDAEIRLATLSDVAILGDDIIANPICVEIKVYN